MTISFERQSAFVERRRYGRAPLGIPVAVRERSRSAVEVRMIDFTAVGCQVDGVTVIARDAQIFVKLPGLESQPARIVWMHDMRLGLEFEAQLHPAVAARFLPASGSHAATTITRQIDGYDPLLSRREQILSGISGSDLSPLQRKKKPTGLGLLARIDRRVTRQAEHRAERRYSDAIPQGTRLAVEGELAKVLNVSPSGIKISAALADKEIGAKLALEFDGFPAMTGELVWLREAEAGIALPPQSIELFDRAAG